MTIITIEGPTSPREIRKYLMARTKDTIVFEYLRQWRYVGELEDKLQAAEKDLSDARETISTLRFMLERCSSALLDRGVNALARECDKTLRQFGVALMTKMSEAKHSVLSVMARRPNGISASGIGYVAFPDGKFKSPQGAAFASARLRRELQDAGMIRLHIETIHGFQSESWRITQKGRDSL